MLFVKIAIVFSSARMFNNDRHEKAMKKAVVHHDAHVAPATKTKGTNVKAMKAIQATNK